MATAPLARPAPASPSIRSDPTSWPLVRLRHPGYGKLPNNVLLTLPAVDSAVQSPSPQSEPRPGPRWLGLHHRTALIAGAIVANNAFDRAYLSHDQAATQPVRVPLDGLLDPGSYWLQLRGEEPRTAGDAHDDEQDADAMPPPLRLQPSSSSTQCPTPPRPISSTPPATTASVHEPYPIVPSFGDWRFPHGELPACWKAPHQPPGIASPAETPSSTSALSNQVRNRCYLTDLRMGTNKCRLIPSEKSDWFGINGMGEYATTSPGTVGDEANIAILQSSFHQLFDHRHFVIVPKPVSPSDTDVTSTTSQGQQARPSSYALAIHVLTNHEENGEFPDLYQNASMQTKYVDRLSREFLFARFAWALFPLLRTFLDTPVPRRVAVITYQGKHEPARVSSDLSQPRAGWMNGAEFRNHLHRRGESRSGSRKRASSQMTRDGESELDDDDYKDRRQRRSRRLNSVDALDRATMWFEQVGRYASVDHSNHDWEYNDRYRGRSARRDDEHMGGGLVSDVGSDAGSGDVPLLSRSFAESRGSSDMPGSDHEEDSRLCPAVHSGEPVVESAPDGLTSKNQAFGTAHTRANETRPD